MFGERLKKLREKRGLLQKDVARVLGITDSAVGMYENGRRQPDTETLRKLADFFGVSTDWLLGCSDVRRPGGAKETLAEEAWPEGYSVIARGAKKLTPEDRKKFIALIKAAFPDEFEDKPGK